MDFSVLRLSTTIRIDSFADRSRELPMARMAVVYSAGTEADARSASDAVMLPAVSAVVRIEFSTAR